MSTVQIFDRPMCCSTGICGPSVDPVLPRFASDLEWLRSLGHVVERFNLAQQPAAFVQNSLVRQLLNDQGPDCLPIVLVDGQVASRGEYPTRARFAPWVGAVVDSSESTASESIASSSPANSQISNSLPIV